MDRLFGCIVRLTLDAIGLLAGIVTTVFLVVPFLVLLFLVTWARTGSLWYAWRLTLIRWKDGYLT